MTDRVEKALSQLESTDLGVAVKGAAELSDMISHKNIPFYLQHLTGKDALILKLITKQYQNFFTHYYKPESVQSDETNAKLKTLLESCLPITSYLFSPKMSADISREAIYEYVHSIVPFKVKRTVDREQSYATRNGLNFFHPEAADLLGESIEAMVWSFTSLLKPYINPLPGYSASDANTDYRVVSAFAATVVRLLRDYTAKAHSKSAQLSSESREQLDQSITALTGLLESFVRKDRDEHYKESDLIKVVQKVDLPSVLYEMYALLELYLEMGKSAVYMDTSAAQHISTFLMVVMKAFGNTAWTHFDLIDKDLVESGKSPDKVALFKLLAERGFVRPSQVSEEAVAASLVAEPEVIPPENLEFVDVSLDDSFEQIEANAEVPESATPEVVPFVADPQAEAKMSNEEILQQVQMMSEQMVKSQRMINELLGKLNI